ncbi:hypothetical protein M441DRAFT_437957 [Trichoderma asperellum CBS 433.97]|uniref:Uncharacterized protein n=1 Tax=Trichoderma asperellum (strain ATCC 204424 / CBS 433.97 / NBRC 101777) TaxID=1042311 RepID=A0A2T3Z3Q1_TRIA4|nr:hypothetical protein M441DRAFT_437957 [Trichoderma asperellum CBS 433.97]PTB39429.1 hypothetical protein M441DRAFT_437957 [Trichoderma asperellum CBS 433.97]
MQVLSLFCASTASCSTLRPTAINGALKQFCRREAPGRSRFRLELGLAIWLSLSEARVFRCRPALISLTAQFVSGTRDEKTSEDPSPRPDGENDEINEERRPLLCFSSLCLSSSSFWRLSLTASASWQLSLRPLSAQY